jgi:hypothetical protein
MYSWPDDRNTARLSPISVVQQHNLDLGLMAAIYKTTLHVRKPAEGKREDPVAGTEAGLRGSLCRNDG